MPAAVTRRSALAVAVALITCRAAPVAAAPIYAAIRRAEAADAADREAGRHARALHRAGRPVPAGWKSYRAGLRQARTAARFDLHSLTPSTSEAAAALVAYYRDRAAASGEPATAHHAPNAACGRCSAAPAPSPVPLPSPAPRLPDPHAGLTGARTPSPPRPPPRALTGARLMTHVRTIPDFSRPLPPREAAQQHEPISRYLTLPQEDAPGTIEPWEAVAPVRPDTPHSVALRFLNATGEALTAVLIIAGGIAAYGYLPPL